MQEDIKRHLDSFVSKRKRLISKYKITFQGNHSKKIPLTKAIEIKRVPSTHFIQTYANSLETSDYRHSARTFKELPDVLFDENLTQIIQFIFLEIRRFSVFDRARLIVHHVLIECIEGESATNSPEGIHQDGMDFIMSAFVREQKYLWCSKYCVCRRQKE
ncbi:2OG-Fe dioxygenase family protein [Helicobacter sp. MIT 14-3879]|uniref:2OG-Fe dioxygenase family protein n=1 Tax=Helicobacter sp. MIT 14-3879 TaxID=2040649 RepID=UPI0015F16D59|nr:2OG-Fe dioxygenase family protein [Helicobacter sp. MIT 14-3879]